MKKDTLIRISIPENCSEAESLFYAFETLMKPVGFHVIRHRHNGHSGGSNAELTWEDTPGESFVRLDLGQLKSAFDRLSGREESQLPTDSLHRIEEQTLQRDYSRPSLSEWAWDLAYSLRELNPSRDFKKPRFTVHLTHDVDRVNSLDPMGLLRRILVPTRGVGRGFSSRLTDLLWWVWNSDRFRGTYETVMRMESEAGAVATYFFMSGPYSWRKTGSRTGACGRNRRLMDLASLAKRYGHRIGMHGCAYSLDRADYARQREALCEATESEITWHRNHYLVWDPLRSPRALKEAGIRVDSTVGFNTFQAFRAGMAWPYTLWDHQSHAAAEVTEIPMVFMDSAGEILYEGYPWPEIHSQLEKVEEVGGEVALNFHLDYFVGMPSLVEGYGQLLKWLQDKGCILGGRVGD